MLTKNQNLYCVIYLSRLLNSEKQENERNLESSQFTTVQFFGKVQVSFTAVHSPTTPPNWLPWKPPVAWLFMKSKVRSKV